MLDYFGKEVEAGHIIAYGKSDRDYPMSVGKVLEVNDKSLKVIGAGKGRAAVIKGNNHWSVGFSGSTRVIILSDFNTDVLDQLEFKEL